MQLRCQWECVNLFAHRPHPVPQRDTNGAGGKCAAAHLFMYSHARSSSAVTRLPTSEPKRLGTCEMILKFQSSFYIWPLAPCTQKWCNWQSHLSLPTSSLSLWLFPWYYDKLLLDSYLRVKEPLVWPFCPHINCLLLLGARDFAVPQRSAPWVHNQKRVSPKDFLLNTMFKSSLGS